MTGGGAYLGTEFLKVAEMLGAHAVLQKPFELGAFVDTIRRLLADHGARSGRPAPPRREAGEHD
jgi:hypothetical protein